MNPLNKYLDSHPSNIPFSTLHLSELEPLALFAGNAESQHLAIRELVARLREAERVRQEGRERAERHHFETEWNERRQAKEE